MTAALVVLASMAAGCSTVGLGEGAYAPPPSAAPAAGNGLFPMGATVPAPVAPAASAPPSAGKAGSVVGVWEGQTWAGCSVLTPFNRCNAQQKVTLTLFEGPSGLTGQYRCAYLNMNCYDMNETGKIVNVNVDGKRLTVRVAMPDATSCLYTGLIAGNNLNGGYTCYGGGAVIEMGSWRSQHSY